jgi:hypothetical protein
MMLISTAFYQPEVEMDYKRLAENLMVAPKGGISTHEKNVNRPDMLEAIKRGMGRPKRHPDDKPTGIKVMRG